jgi:hypothetical protein
VTQFFSGDADGARTDGLGWRGARTDGLLPEQEEWLRSHGVL